MMRRIFKQLYACSVKKTTLLVKIRIRAFIFFIQIKIMFSRFILKPNLEDLYSIQPFLFSMFY